MKKYLLISFLLALFFVAVPGSDAFAQLSVGEIAIGGSQNDVGYSIVQTKDKGYTLAGMDCSFTYYSEACNVYLVHLDSMGTLKWTKTVGGNLWDQANSMIQTDDGGYAIAGFTDSYYNETYVIRFDSMGNVKWERVIAGPGLAEGYSIIQASDRGFVVAGYTAYDSTGDIDASLIKLDSWGNVVWLKTVGGKYADQANSVALSKDGGYVIAGYTQSFGDTTYGDIYVVKFDSSGNLKWTKTFGGKGADEAYSIVGTTDGGYAITGASTSWGAGSYNIYLLRLDSSGNIKWARNINGTCNNYGYSLIQARDGSFVITGITCHGGGNYIYLLRIDSSGALIWNKTIGGTVNDQGYSVIQTKDNGYAIAGYTQSYGTGGENLCLVKLDSNGNTCSTMGTHGTIANIDTINIDSGGIVRSYSVALLDSGMVDSGGIQTNNCIITGEHNNSILQTSVKVLPNPNNGKFTIESSVNGRESLVEIYNVLGKKIYSNTFSTLNSSFSINLINQPSGIYMYRITDQQGKLIKADKVMIVH
jgi:hypothetical protein